MDMIIVHGSLYENRCNLEFNPFIKNLFTVFTIFFIVVYIFKQREKRIIHNDTYAFKRQLKLCNPCDEHPVDISIDLQFITTNISYNEVQLPTEIVKFDNEIVRSIDRRELICYTDGSYCRRMQIGHSGFRASDGSSTVHCYFPRCPKRGSTESEVFAASLAIQHATKNRYNVLIIHTDNSKVEQLLCRPKEKDNCDYPVFCKILNQYRQENENNIILVERVRGHTTRNEQNQCEIKREFAKIDRLVRKKNRRYIRRQEIQYAQFYLYWYSQYNTFTSDYLNNFFV